MYLFDERINLKKKIQDSLQSCNELCPVIYSDILLGKKLSLMIY